MAQKQLIKLLQRYLSGASVEDLKKDYREEDIYAILKFLEVYKPLKPAIKIAEESGLSSCLCYDLRKELKRFESLRKADKKNIENMIERGLPGVPLSKL